MAAACAQSCVHEQKAKADCEGPVYVEKCPFYKRMRQTGEKMRVRVKFSKSGVMKFIGHLDVMRYFQKAMRRAEIDIAYSEGMSPHMIMSFAQPLGVGLTSDGEYMDVEVRTPIASKEAIERLNRVGVDGITVTQWRQIPEDKANKAMTLVAGADYELRFRKGYAP